MTKILILWIAFLCVSVFSVYAQGVDFQKLSFEEALEKARVENKLVFMDCYTSWCGPCQNMLKNVFTRPEAGELLNLNFVNVKFDMEKGEGVVLKKKFNIRSYPTFLLIRPDGRIQHRIVGGGELDHFIDRVKRGKMEKTSLFYLDGCYQKRKLQKKQYPLYVEALSDASDDEKIKEVCAEGFRRLGDKEKCGYEGRYLYDQPMIPTDERFVYMIHHQSLLEETMGKEAVEKKIYSVYLDALREVCRGEGYDYIVLIDIVEKQLKEVEFSGKQNVQCLLEYACAYRHKDVEEMLEVLENHLTDLPEYVWTDILFQFEFIVRSGSNEQLSRYIKVGEELIQLMKNSRMKELSRDFFDKYQAELNDRISYAEIKGRVTKNKMAEVGLYEVLDGAEVLIGKTGVGINGLYGFSFEPPRSGFYTVGGEKSQERIRIYLKPGDKAEVNILEDTLVITRRNTAENVLLAQWESLFEPVRRRVGHLDFISFNYKDFFPYFTNFLPKAEGFRNDINSRNEEFNELLRKTVDFDLDYAALLILYVPKIDLQTHSGCHPNREDYTDYYTTLVSVNKLKDTMLLKQSYGRCFLQYYTTFALNQEKKDASLKNRIALLPCDLLKAELVLWYAESCRNYEKYKKIVDEYSFLLKTKSHHKRMDKMTAKLYEGSVGKEAADFTYPDRNGKMVSLSDFRGKVVLVDVWATWCGPCRKEVPYLVQLEKEMEGKDVVFIGVSVDEKKNYQKWLNVLQKEGMEGVQLFADGWSKIVSDYKIKGIPRFMVFGRDGKVVTIDSPRPSSPELKKLLEKTLAN